MTTNTNSAQRLRDVSALLEQTLSRRVMPPPRFAESEIRRSTLFVAMRDGTRLATDLYLPPVSRAPTVAMRTPYGRAIPKNVGVAMAFARQGYVVVSQDCRGTGESEPSSWDYYVFESEDGYDLAEWISTQTWFDGFLGACGGSYVGQTQWCMALHPAMSAIAPEVSSLGVVVNTTHLYMLLNAFSRTVGRGKDKLPMHFSELERLMKEETLAGGFFNEPLYPSFSNSLASQFPRLSTLSPQAARRWLWETYCALPSAQRAALIKNAREIDQITMADVEALSCVFGHSVCHDAHTLPSANPAELCASLQAPVLMIAGWYDWALNDEIATWNLLRDNATATVASRSRIILSPAAHNVPGYREGQAEFPELQHSYRTENILGLLLAWYEAIRNDAIENWPPVIYYLMGANEWRASSQWPPTCARRVELYLGPAGALTWTRPADRAEPDRYTYDPMDPTPTVGGSVLSSVYPPGSVDVSEVQKRSDVLTYTTPVLESDLDVVGPLHMILFAKSSAVDTDFTARLSDVFPDGRAVQLQCGIVRARFRNPQGEPELLEPGRIYQFDIDMWATANRFKRGHRLRVDISSADFPRFDRNSNLGGGPGKPIVAMQTIFHDKQHPSRLLLGVVDEFEADTLA